jgi:anti-sigma regulatory factor (Ser/Thr protein kinase)
MRLSLFDPESDHGWGLPIAHAATDALSYERLPDGRNQWRLEKRLLS